MVVPQNIKLELLYDMANPLVLYIQDNWKDSCRYLSTHVHNSTIHNNQKVEAIQVSMMDEWMNKSGISKQWNTVVVQSLTLSNFLWRHGLQPTRLPWPSLSPRVCLTSCPLSQWWHPIISTSVTCFSSCPQSFPASGYFPMSWFFSMEQYSVLKKKGILTCGITWMNLEDIVLSENNQSQNAKYHTILLLWNM